MNQMSPYICGQEAEDSAKCVSLGFSPGTEAFGNCRLQLMAIDQQTRMGNAAAYNAAMQGYKAASQPFGGVYTPRP